MYLTNKIILLDRFCPDPPVPLQWQQYDWDGNLTTKSPFRHEVTYSCDLARKLNSGVDDNGEDILINEHTIKCEWNQTWSPYDEVRAMQIQYKNSYIFLFSFSVIQVGSLHGFDHPSTDVDL